MKDEAFSRLLSVAVVSAAVLTSLGSGMVLFHTITSNDNPMIWSVVQFGVASYTLAMGVLSLVWILARKGSRILVMLGALGLLILGLKASAFSTFMALTGNDPEYWAVLLSYLIAAQALGLLLGLFLDKKSNLEPVPASSG